MQVSHVIFVGLLVGTEAFFTALAVLNLRHGAETLAAEREWVRDRLDVSNVDRIVAYQRANVVLGRTQSWFVLGVILLALYTGVVGTLVELLQNAALPFGDVGRGLAFLLGGITALQVLSWPVDAVDTFWVEERFDFNRQTPGLWLRDKLLGLLVTLVLGGALAGAVVLFVEWTPTLWWVLGWLAVLAFSVVNLVLYPRVIAPLFNDFEPLDSGDLRAAIEDVFERAGFTTSGIYEMDASRRSSHVNAYFVGFGRTKRVVLFDTLVDKLSVEEVKSVLAHELAHWKHGHIWRQLGANAVRMLVVFAVLGFLVDSPWLYRLFGIPTDAAYAGLALAVLVVWPLLRFSAPLSNRLSIAHEREADAFATRVVGEPEPLVDALCRLASENLSNPFPHPVYAAFHYSHPPIPDRIRHVRAQAEGGDSRTA